MAAADVLPLPAGTIQAGIGYLPAGSEHGRLWKPGTVGQLRAIAKLDRPQIPIQDLRESDFQPKLDVNGFQFVTGLPPVDPSLGDGDKDAQEKFYAETVRLMKEQTGASHVHLFGHVYRKDAFQQAMEIPDDLEDDSRSPFASTAQFSHIDQSYAGAKTTLENIAAASAPEVAEDLTKRMTSQRWAIVNSWRPVGRPVNREPLACTDGRTVLDTDLRTTNVDASHYRTGKGGLGQIWHAVHQPAHQWYWASGMTPTEGLLIKCFDTRMDGGRTCRRALHSAFQHPKDSGDGRRSCELRCILFWDDQPQTEEEREKAFLN